VKLYDLSSPLRLKTFGQGPNVLILLLGVVLKVTSLNSLCVLQKSAYSSTSQLLVLFSLQFCQIYLPNLRKQEIMNTV
jgi:hypothetical protein